MKQKKKSEYGAMKNPPSLKPASVKGAFAGIEFDSDNDDWRLDDDMAKLDFEEDFCDHDANQRP